MKLSEGRSDDLAQLIAYGYEYVTDDTWKSSEYPKYAIRKTDDHWEGINLENPVAQQPELITHTLEELLDVIGVPRLVPGAPVPYDAKEQGVDYSFESLVEDELKKLEEACKKDKMKESDDEEEKDESDEEVEDEDEESDKEKKKAKKSDDDEEVEDSEDEEKDKK